jgi:CRP-like cAMP-binding protein
MEPMPRI